MQIFVTTNSSIQGEPVDIDPSETCKSLLAKAVESLELDKNADLVMTVEGQSFNLNHLYDGVIVLIDFLKISHVEYLKSMNVDPLVDSLETRNLSIVKSLFETCISVDFIWDASDYRAHLGNSYVGVASGTGHSYIMENMIFTQEITEWFIHSPWHRINRFKRVIDRCPKEYAYDVIDRTMAMGGLAIMLNYSLWHQGKYLEYLLDTASPEDSEILMKASFETPYFEFFQMIVKKIGACALTDIKNVKSLIFYSKYEWMRELVKLDEFYPIMCKENVMTDMIKTEKFCYIRSFASIAPKCIEIKHLKMLIRKPDTFEALWENFKPSESDISSLVRMINSAIFKSNDLDMCEKLKRTFMCMKNG